MDASRETPYAGLCERAWKKQHFGCRTLLEWKRGRGSVPDSALWKRIFSFGTTVRSAEGGVLLRRAQEGGWEVELVFVLVHFDCSAAACGERKVEAGWKGWGWSRSVFKAARMLPHNARMYVRGRLVSSSANSSGARGRGGMGARDEAPGAAFFGKARITRGKPEGPATRLEPRCTTSPRRCSCF